MNRMRLATNITITVLGTLLIAAIGYGGVARAQNRTGPTEQASPAPTPVAKPIPSPIALPSPTPTDRLFVWDADMVDPIAGWLLLTDCNAASPTPCHYSVERTANGGSSWSDPVTVGPEYSPQNGDAPRTIRFLDRDNGFVYGHTSAYVTHDGGFSWTDAGLPGEIVAIAPFGNVVWALTRPCAKGVLCAYEIRSSLDAGKTWSAPHQIAPPMSPDALVAFGTGVIVSTPPPGNLEWTADEGVTWHDVKSPCAADQFRGDATTADGVEIWVLCQAYPDAFGVSEEATILVSGDGGKSWTTRPVPGIVPRWLVSPEPKTALVSGKGPMVLTSDSGATWKGVAMNGLDGGPFSAPRFWSGLRGWAMDSTRNAWLTGNGGLNWVPIGPVPSTRP
jgi:photosystem II stability/assembly factor-like uncharacterized protein